MYVYRNISWKIIFSFAWKNVLFFILYGTLIVYIFHYFDHKGINIGIPFQPLSTIGIAVAFYISFKNNQSYDRFWEGRKIWGEIVNYSRTWGNQVLSYVSLRHTDGNISQEELIQIQKTMIYRHLAWINALRLQLRKQSPFSKDRSKMNSNVYGGRPGGADWTRDVAPFLSCTDEMQYVQGKINSATQIVRLQGKQCKDLLEKGLIEDFRHMDLMKSMEVFYNCQGKAERINSTPLPRQYAFFSLVFVWIFILILPFGLVGEFSEMGHNFILLTIPFYTIIAWIFHTMEVVGDSSEDPFENFINDVPMTALCRTIERDLRDMLEEEDIPAAVEANNGVLM